MDIGLVTRLNLDGKGFEAVQQLGLQTCQLLSFNPELATREVAEAVVRESEQSGVRVCAMWGGFTGYHAWNFTEGPLTLGLVPRETRAERVEALKRWADFAVWIGSPSVVTHCGFIPENMTDPEYDLVVGAIREVTEYCAKKGIEFWFETGQETPIVLLRTIQRIGMSNLGITLDPANLIMYGKGNPVDALDVIGPYVRNVHIKDGLYPTNGNALGERVAVGKGKVDFPKLFEGLRTYGYQGEWIIERVGGIGDDKNNRVINEEIDFLKRHVAGAGRYTEGGQ